jgi:hypothetical protein
LMTQIIRNGIWIVDEEQGQGRIATDDCQGYQSEAYPNEERGRKEIERAKRLDIAEMREA